MYRNKNMPLLCPSYALYTTPHAPVTIYTSPIALYFYEIY